MTRADASPIPPPRHRGPTIALALGGGGARGLAHIPVLEVFDELGIRPKMIAGTSIGAIFGAAYASGMRAAEIRAHTEEVLGQRFELVRELFRARAPAIGRVLGLFSTRSAFLEPTVLLDLILPTRFPTEFAQLPTHLKVVATDFYAQESRVFASGPLRPAIAASMALPVVFQPVPVEGRAMIDGGLSNPLPFDILTGDAEIVVAIDVTGAPLPSADRALPTASEALFGSAFLFERALIREKLKSQQPDILIDAGMSRFQVLDFLKARDILAAAEPAKDALKRQLGRLLEAETLDALPPPIIQENTARPPPEEVRKRARRKIFKRPSRRRADD